MNVALTGRRLAGAWRATHFHTFLLQGDHRKSFFLHGNSDDHIRFDGFGGNLYQAVIKAPSASQGKMDLFLPHQAPLGIVKGKRRNGVFMGRGGKSQATTRAGISLGSQFHPQLALFTSH
jgi:hypothetical protein